VPGGGFSGRLPLEWLIGIAHEVRPFDRIVGVKARERFGA
jgi:hypothetical protein